MSDSVRSRQDMLWTYASNVRMMALSLTRLRHPTQHKGTRHSVQHAARQTGRKAKDRDRSVSEEKGESGDIRKEASSTKAASARIIDDNGLHGSVTGSFSAVPPSFTTLKYLRADKCESYVNALSCHIARSHLPNPRVPARIFGFAHSFTDHGVTKS
ncbi:hypothetical protein MAPG_02432 [Magnaporthiopsis poae ATCC 64411]|uniref:Uncharacterized protein n=1 Tax=Magnaporthiopsis poae (strain ATCC 64411 / 73-15) TaxID=644358 RepID=A0A0C4DRC4_MAGP6|nr:hypothetical protein MAPG_02432 [Magnaporthiopsis poae ATCC 64411]